MNPPVVLALVLLLAGSALAERRLPPPSPGLLRSLEGLQRDLEQLDRSLMPPVGEADSTEPPALLAELTAPPPQALPATASAITIRRRVRLSLATALAVAVRNDPELAAEVRSVAERRDLANAARGRWWPELAVDLAGQAAGVHTYNAVWDDNAGLYPAGSPFLVKPGGWNLLQTNSGFGAAGLTLAWEPVSPERGRRSPRPTRSCALPASAMALACASCSWPPVRRTTACSWLIRCNASARLCWSATRWCVIRWPP